MKIFLRVMLRNATFSLLLVAFILQVPLYSAEICYDHKREFDAICDRAVQSLKEASSFGLFNIYKHIEWPFHDWREYFFKCSSQYTYSDYVSKYNDLFWWCKVDFGNMISNAEENIEEYQKKLAADPTSDYKEQIQYYREKITYAGEHQALAENALHTGLDDLQTQFLELYSGCIRNHKHPSAYYERGKIFFDQGDAEKFLCDIGSLIATEQAQDYHTPDILLTLSKGYYEVHLYDAAIAILSEAIAKAPNNKELFFERALAYFEIGNYEASLADYLQSGQHPTMLNSTDRKHFSYIKFSQGIVQGAFDGGIHSTLDFVPSMLATVKGIGVALWAVASNPIGISKELVDSTRACMEFIRANANAETLAALVPELKSCIEQWHDLDDEKKGYHIGYVIAHYGVDILAWSGCVKAMQLYRQVKRANAMMVLETASISSQQAEAIIKESAMYVEGRKNFLNKYQIHWDKQNKHIAGTHNFRNTNTIIKIPKAELESLLKAHAGTGHPIVKQLGDAGYKERVNFGKVIGDCSYEHETKGWIVEPTTFGIIHYDKNGYYHVVPARPKGIS